MTALKTITVHDIKHDTTVDINIAQLRFRRSADVVEKGRFSWIDAELSVVKGKGGLTYVNFANGQDAVEVVFDKPIADVRKMFDEFILSDDTQVDWSKETLTYSKLREIKAAVVKAANEAIKKAAEDRLAAEKAAEKAKRDAQIQRIKRIAGHFNVVGKIRRNGFWWQNKAAKPQGDQVEAGVGADTDTPKADKPAQKSAKTGARQAP